jgi:hypothetical protein
LRTTARCSEHYPLAAAAEAFRALAAYRGTKIVVEGSND